MVINPLTKWGAAAVSLDHVTKDKEGRGRYAIGGVHKLNIVSGAGYILENRQPFGIGAIGRSTLRIAKDRPAQLRANAVPLDWYGDLVLAEEDGSAWVRIEPPQERDAQPKIRPTTLMEKISKYLEDAEEPVSSQNQILTDVPGKRDWKIEALRLLRKEGYVTPARPYTLLKPYRQRDENDHETS